MDSVSSASRSLMEYLTIPTPSARAPTRTRCTILELSGVALTVPYVIKLGVSASEVLTLELDVCAAVQDVFKEAEERFSPFLPSSELERINKARHTDRIVVSEAMGEVVAMCNDLVEWSGGRFDPTCVPVGRWAVAAVKEQLRSNKAAMPPDEVAVMNASCWFPSTHSALHGDADTGGTDDALSSAVDSVMKGSSFREKQQHVGWLKNIVVGPGWIQKRNPHTELDVSAVSKGWTVDVLCNRLGSTFGLLDIYVDWGGDIRCLGASPQSDPDGGSCSYRPWNAGILVPPHGITTSYGCEHHLTLPSECGASLCTSGDYYQWSHLVDAVVPAPLVRAQGAPQQPTSVSLMLKDTPCAMCDGLSTALFLMLRHLPCDDVVRQLAQGVPRRCNGNAVGAFLVMMRTSDGTLERSDLTNTCLLAMSAVPNDDGRVTPTRSTAVTRSDPPTPTWRSSLLDTRALRSLFQCVARSVHILLLPMDDEVDRGAPAAVSAQGGATRRYFGCTVSSLVQVSSTTAAVFLELHTAAAALVEQKLAAPADAVGRAPWHFAVAYVAPDAVSRTVQTGAALLEVFQGGKVVSPDSDLLKDALCVCTYTATSTTRHLVGDHVLLCGEWQEPTVLNHSRGRKSPQRMPGGRGDDVGGPSPGFHPHQHLDPSSPPCSLLLRARKKYLSVSIPRPPQRWHSLPRARCVATVCVGDIATGRVVRCLGTVLMSIDISSRQPLLLTAYARPGQLHDVLFAQHVGGTQPPDSDTLTLVRLHMFAHKSSDGDALLDWFQDVTCVDAAMQFMYHAAPSRTMTKLHDAAHPPEEETSRGVWVHDYRFPGGPQIGTVDTTVAWVLPQGPTEGYLVVLRPVQCSTVGDFAERDDTVASYGFL
jgi:thiamine biosynthesis lipoprotein ApbE